MASSSSSSPPSSPSPTNTTDLIPQITRLSDSDGFLATIRYVGPVASAKNSSEIYVGVEWDDASRGRHDGSVVCRRTNGIVRHFRCQNGVRRSENNSGSGGASGENAAQSTPASSTAGSFLRLSKRNSDWTTGIPLTPALLRSRYVPPSAPLVAPANLLPHHALTSSGRKKEIEFVGEQKIRERQQPNNKRMVGVSLRSMGIGGAPPSERGTELAEFAHLTEMDLAGNLLCTWNDVLDVLASFPHLEKVGLAGNRIGDVDEAIASEAIASEEKEFDKIHMLNLNGTDISSMRTVAWVGSIMPNLEELCLAHCDLSDLDTYDADIDQSMAKMTLHTSNSNNIPRPISSGGGGILWLANLRFLDLSDCCLTSWTHQVGRLARSLPQLTDLILNDNPLGVIEAFAEGGNNDADDSKYFPSLTTLQLTNADITSWSSIDALHAATPNLKSLRFRSNPITSMISAAESRSVTIARLPKLEYLNASPISDKERVDSERRYVSHVARELLMAETAVAAEMDNEGGEGKSTNGTEDAVAAAKKQRIAAILANHPLFHQLTAKHQDAMSAARAAASGNTATGGSLSHDAINVTIRSMAASSCSTEPLRRRLPGSLAVGRVKILCSRAFGLDVDLQTLHFRSGDGADAFPTELDDDDNALSYYGVTDGAEILMNEIDVEARKRDVEREKALQEQRIEEQERTATALQAAQTKGFEVKA